MKKFKKVMTFPVAKKYKHEIKHFKKKSKILETKYDHLKEKQLSKINLCL